MTEEVRARRGEVISGVELWTLPDYTIGKVTDLVVSGPHDLVVTGTTYLPWVLRP
jgi:hypothetical protein